MSADAWFPRFSPDGSRIACGSAVVTICRADGSEPVVVGPGTSPKWLSNDRVIYTRQPDGALCHWPSGAVLDRDGFNDVDACDGRWAGWHAGRDEVVTSWGLRLPGCRMPRLSATGLAYVQPIPGDLWRIVAPDGRVVTEGAIRDLRAHRWGALVWAQHVGGRWETWGWQPGQAAPQRLHVAQGHEYWPVPCEWGDGEPWVMTHTETALWLRPWGSSSGHIVHVGVTDFPDAIWTPQGWRVAWSERGHLRTAHIPHDRPMTVFRETPAPEPPKEPEPERPKEPAPVSYTSIAPNMLHVVEAIHRERPGLIHRPHDFTAAVAARLHALDPKWGLNGKRGNIADTSEDCVAYRAPASPAGGVEIYDIIAQANSPQAAPAWIDQTWVTVANGTIGAWVQPPSATTPTPEPRPPSQPPPTVTCRALSLDEVRAAVRQEMALVLERVAHTDGVVTGLIDAVRSVQEQLANAATRREELCDLTAERIEATTTAREVSVSGRVSFTGTTTLRGTVGQPATE